jgi:uncharacterized NAD(P)/FAD-binding protein YdhS
MITVAIVGGGCSAAMLAVQLLRQPGPVALHVVLIDPQPEPGAGLAYGSAGTQHLLNVPAGNMSALADVPDDFLAWLRRQQADAGPSTFATRRDYGRYMRERLADAQAQAAGGRTLEALQASVEDVQPASDGRGALVVLAGGRRIAVNHAVLAIGHAGGLPLPALCSLPAGRVVHDPWAAPGLPPLAPDACVVIVGSGLTAVDVALDLAARPQPPAGVVCLSRHGLLPMAHRRQRGHFAAASAAALVAGWDGTVRSQLRALRLAIVSHTLAGGDWRDVLAALRAHTPAWWQALPLPERARFLRHLQPLWDVARHRCAPEAHARFTALRDAGWLRVQAGRILGAQEAAGVAELLIAPRGGGRPRLLRTDLIVNCTGPRTALAALAPGPAAALLQRLHQAGHLCPDALGLGLAVDGAGALLDAQGWPSPVLSYLGPWLRARDWEATAVPELRQHALALAQRLLGDAAAAPGPAR